MDKKKFKRGAMITDFETLVRCDFIWWQIDKDKHKIIHYGWFQNWSLKYARNMFHKIYIAYK